MGPIRTEMQRWARTLRQLVGAAQRAPAFETVVLAAVVPATVLWQVKASWLPDADSLWPAFIPLLLGLRYGLRAGLGASTLLVAVMGGFTLVSGTPAREFEPIHAVGLLLLGMTAGEFRDGWASRFRKLEAEGSYHRARLDEFTRTYHLLQASHAQLERQLGSNAVSLRTLLQRLKLQPGFAAAKDEKGLEGVGKSLLELFADAGRLHTAALYSIGERGTLLVPAVATLGQAAELSPFNPLLRQALSTGCLTSLRVQQDIGSAGVIAVVPLVDSSGRVHGIVSIHEMPFFALRQSTFDLLAVLGGHVGDILARRMKPLDGTGGIAAFRLCLQRALKDVVTGSVPASLVSVRIGAGPDQADVVARISHEGRGLDRKWIGTDREGCAVVVALLPLTDAAGAECFLDRIGRLADKYGKATDASEAWVRKVWSLSAQHDAAGLLDEVLSRFEVVCGQDVIEVDGKLSRG